MLTTPTPVTRRWAVLFAALAALWLGNLHAEEPPPVLMVLDYDIGGKHLPQPIPMKLGEFTLSEAPPGADKLRITAGDAFPAAAARPSDRAVELYQASTQGRSLVCIVHVRYFRDRAGRWVANFQLVEQPLVARDAQGNWKPFTEIRGTPGLVVLSGSALPNAEGFYPSLEFGLNLKKVFVNSWAVR